MIKKVMVYYIGALFITLILAGIIGGAGTTVGLNKITTGLLVLMGAQLGPAISFLITRIIFRQEKFFINYKIKNTAFLLLSIIIPAVIILSSAGVITLLGKHYIESDIKGAILLLFAISSFIGCFGEEIGWRGYLLPTFREKHSMLISSLLTGLMWGAWHFMKIISYGVMPYLLFIPLIAAFGVIMGWIYFRTEHSLAYMVTFHLCINLVSGLLLTEREGISFYIAGLLISLVVILVIWFVDKEFFYIRKKDTGAVQGE